MNRTLLAVVQELLSSLDSDEVNGINDTEEAMQVATIVEAVYMDMVSDLEVNEVNDMFRLWQGRSEAPASLILPPYVNDMDWVKYNGLILKYVPFEEFLTSTVTGGDKLQTVASKIGEEWRVRFYSDRDPECFTVLDDNLLILDACQDDRSMPSKSLAFGKLFPEFKKQNDFIIPLSVRHMRYLVNRAKVRAFGELKEAQNQEAAAESRLQRLAIRRKEETVANDTLFNRRPRYGRRK
jgi:hypothetical protein